VRVMRVFPSIQAGQALAAARLVSTARCADSSKIFNLITLSSSVSYAIDVFVVRAARWKVCVRRQNINVTRRCRLPYVIANVVMPALRARPI